MFLFFLYICYSLLGLFTTDPETFVKKYGEAEEQIPAEIVELAEKVQGARAVKDYALADSLRAEIDAKGYSIRITREGFELQKK